MVQRMRNNLIRLVGVLACVLVWTPVWILALTATAVNARDAGIASAPAPSASAVPDLAAKQTGSDASAQTMTSPAPSHRSLPDKAEIQSMIDRFAGDYGLDPDLVHALIRVESAYDPQAVSHAGAVGLMQVMPETAVDYGIDSIDQLFEPETNLHTGMRHLKRLLEKYDGIGAAVMAYNAGEGALERGQGFVEYPETQRYTHQVLSDYLIRKGIHPYSPDARRALGMALTPEMAVAGGGSSALRRFATPRSSAMFPGAPSAQTQTARWQSGGAPGPRIRATTLSSRLAVPGHSLLKSRLTDPARRAAAGLSGRSVRQVSRAVAD